MPGRPAPKLIPASAVERMRSGSVIVDLAAETGGNCEVTVPGEDVVHGGVTVIGDANLPVARWRTTRASSTRATSARCSCTSLPKASSTLDWEDEITSGACVTRPEADA